MFHFRIVAYDADEGMNAELHYTLKTLEPGFTIDNDGFIETSKELKDGQVERGKRGEGRRGEEGLRKGIQVSTLDVIVRDGGNPLRESERRIVLSAVKMDAIDKEVRKREEGRREGKRGGTGKRSNQFSFQNNHAPKFEKIDTYKFDVSDADQVKELR